MNRFSNVLLFLGVAIMSIGCNANGTIDWSEFDNVFSEGQATPDDDPSSVVPRCPPDSCGPDGCPYNETDSNDIQTYGTEVSDFGSDSVNTTATQEVKGDCPACPNRPAARPVYRPQTNVVVRRLPSSPTIVNYPPVKLAPGEKFIRWLPNTTKPYQSETAATMPPPEPRQPNVKNNCPNGDCQTPREGVFVCQRCKRPTVGAGWHELWADDGTPLTCLCESCWRALSPSQRAAELRKYANTQSIGGLSPIVQTAIEQAAAKTIPIVQPMQSYGTEL